MNRKVIPFTTEEAWLAERAKDITSTEIAALFGISPYLTKYELWHRKKNQELGQFEPNERMKWGTRLQESIARGIAEDEAWNIRPMKEYIRWPELRIGSSFDYCIGVAKEPFSEWLLEIKNVDGLAFKEGWLVDGENVEAPPHIELQVQQQLLISEYGLAFIGALVGGNKVVLIKREVDKAIHDEIKKQVAAFWKSIEDNQEPEPDFKRDADFIARLYGKAEKDSVAYADQEVTDLAMLYRHASEAAKVADTQKKEYKAKILTKIGTTSKVMSDSFTITANEVKPSHVEAFDKPGFRNFRITFKGDKIND